MSRNKGDGRQGGRAKVTADDFLVTAIAAEVRQAERGNIKWTEARKAAVLAALATATRDDVPGLIERAKAVPAPGL